MQLTELLSYLVNQWLSYPRPAERIVSAIGIDVHWTILQYVMGLPFMAFIAQLIYLRTRDQFWLRLARTLVKGFVIIFAVGAATGTTAEFGLILLWPQFLEVGGKFIFFPFYAEVYAFLMEVIFVYLLYHGWSKVGDRTRLFLTLLVFVGAWYSGAMIMAVNSYMVAPSGLEPAYDPQTGAYMYSEGYPRIEVVVPANIVELLNQTWLADQGVSVKKMVDNGVLASVPSRIVYALFHEASQGYAMNQSILWEGVLPEHRSQVSTIPVAEILDQILQATVEYHDPLLYPFKSPSWIPSVMHTIGAALVVSGYTVAGAYALRILTGTGRKSESQRALRFALIYTLAVLIVQGAVFGHEMGVEVAHYNPEKFAAIEGTSRHVLSITRDLMGGLGEKLAAFLAYGDPEAPLPQYDEIPSNWCLTGNATLSECRPPLIIHYAYYTKIGLSVAMGLFTLAVALAILRGKQVTRPWLIGLALSPLVAQAVSFLGWFVREAGRKPFTVYGMFTPLEAGSPNPLQLTELALVGAYLVAMLLLLAWAVYRFLWKPGSR